ncbi:MAG: protein kinase [Acidobacteriia bacterium]|nr:protein kinase [Terriglobia bacterium]
MSKQSREISHWDIVQSYPAPIAIAYQQYCSVSGQDVVRKARTLFAVAEVTVRYLTLVITADFLSIDPLRPAKTLLDRVTSYWSQTPRSADLKEPVLIPDWLNTLQPGRALQFGVWLRALQEVGNLTSGRAPFMSEAPNLVKNRDVFSLISNLVTLRNKFVHPGGAFELTDDEISALLRQGKPFLARWLGHLHFLRQYSLCIARRQDPFGSSRRASENHYSVMRAMGLSPNHNEVNVELSVSLKEHLPFLVHPDGGRLLYLWPFVIASEPEEKGAFGRLFVFERQTRAHFNSLEYVGIGPRLHFEQAEHVEHRDLSWLRERRRTLPGRLETSRQSLLPLHRETVDRLVGAVFGEERRYTIVRRIGHGGMGVVYVATDETGRAYALKVLQHRDNRTQRRFEREINELGKLKSSTGIVGLIDWGIGKDVNNNPCPYYVMEYAERGDLSTFIRTMCVPLQESKDPIRWDLEPRLKILEQVALALEQLHELNVVHRDIKPENVLLMGDDSIRLADFGLAKALESRTNEPALTEVFSVLGTLEYMAPEQLAGSVASKATDVFAFGVMMFELLMGRLPTRKGISKTGDSGTLFEQQAIQSIPEGLRRILLKCTRYEASERYEDGKKLMRAIYEGLPKIRRGELRVRTEPSGALVELDGKQITNENVEVESGVHILSATKLQLLCAPKVVRIPPLATVEVVLVLEQPSMEPEEVKKSGRAVRPTVAVDSVLPFIQAVRLKIVTRSVGYGTSKGVEDQNSHIMWQSMRSQLGTSPVPSLHELVESKDPDTRMKALQFLLYYAMDTPDAVDKIRVQTRMREEIVPVILGAWINYLEQSPEQNWTLLLDLLTAEQLGSSAAGIPSILRRLGDNAEMINRLVLILPTIPYRITREEAVRALSGRHPQATAALIERMNHDPEQSVRLAAVHAVTNGAPQSAFEQLLKGLETDPAASVRTACARAMISVDPTRAELEFKRLNTKRDPAIDAAIEGAKF